MSKLSYQLIQSPRLRVGLLREIDEALFQEHLQKAPQPSSLFLSLFLSLSLSLSLPLSLSVSLSSMKQPTTRKDTPGLGVPGCRQGGTHVTGTNSRAEAKVGGVGSLIASWSVLDFMSCITSPKISSLAIFMLSCTSVIRVGATK